MLIVTGKQISL